MKIAFTDSLSTTTNSYRRGEVVDLPEAEAASWVRNGWAIWADTETAPPERIERKGFLRRMIQRFG